MFVVILPFVSEDIAQLVLVSNTIRTLRQVLFLSLELGTYRVESGRTGVA